MVAIALASPSTGFANPAVTLARGLADTHTGIAASSIAWFVTAQMLGGVAAAGVAFVLYTSANDDVDQAESSVEVER